MFLTNLLNAGHDVYCELIYFFNATIFCCNEVTFITQSVLISIFVIACFKLGKSALVALMAVCWILGNFFALQEATLFGFEAVTSDPFAIGATLSMTFLSEYYGEKSAQKALSIGVVMALFFVLMAIMQISYMPNMFDTTHHHFSALLGRMTRVIFASFIVSTSSQLLNLFLFKNFTRILGHKFFSISTFFAVAISQLFDTAFFTLLALSGNVHSIMHIIIFSTLIKWISLAISIPFIQIFRSRKASHSEQ